MLTKLNEKVQKKRVTRSKTRSGTRPKIKTLENQGLINIWWPVRNVNRYFKKIVENKGLMPYFVENQEISC